MYLDMKINDYDSRIHNDIDYLHEFFSKSFYRSVQT